MGINFVNGYLKVADSSLTCALGLVFSTVIVGGMSAKGGRLG